MKNVSNIEKRTYRRQHCEWTKKVFKRPTKKHSPRDNRGCASSNNVSLLLMFLAERVGFEPTDGCPSPDFEFFENLGKHRKSASFSRKITETQKRGSARLSSAPHTPKTAQTQEIHRLEIGSKVLSKFSPGGQKSGTLERTQERTHPTKGIRDSSCR